MIGLNLLCIIIKYDSWDGHTLYVIVSWFYPILFLTSVWIKCIPAFIFNQIVFVFSVFIMGMKIRAALMCTASSVIVVGWMRLGMC